MTNNKGIMSVNKKMPLPHGAAMHLRPLTKELMAEASESQMRLLERVLAADIETIRELGPISPVFRNIEKTAAWSDSAGEILFPLELLMLTCIAWEGVVDESGAAISTPTRQDIAALLRDPKILTEVQIVLGAEMFELQSNDLGENNA